MDTALHLLKAGGIAMIPLMACSILAVAIIIEKAYTLRSRKVISPEIAGMVEHLEGDEQIVAAVALCDRINTPFARVIKTGLINRKMARADAMELVQGTARREVTSHERGLLMLEIITGISPLLGLLGTVLGIFHVFNVIVQTGVGEASNLSGGISEALITTIVGLFIAIPAFVAHSYFSKRIDEHILEIERYANMLMHKLYSNHAEKNREPLHVEHEEYARRRQ